MAYTENDIAALESAIARGLTSARRGDEEVRYRSLAEMQAILAQMKAEVRGAAAIPGRLVYPTVTRGL